MWKGNPEFDPHGDRRKRKSFSSIALNQQYRPDLVFSTTYNRFLELHVRMWKNIIASVDDVSQLNFLLEKICVKPPKPWKTCLLSIWKSGQKNVERELFLLREKLKFLIGQRLKSIKSNNTATSFLAGWKVVNPNNDSDDIASWMRSMSRSVPEDATQGDNPESMYRMHFKTICPSIPDPTVYKLRSLHERFHHKTSMSKDLDGQSETADLSSIPSGSTEELDSKSCDSDDRCFPTHQVEVKEVRSHGTEERQKEKNLPQKSGASVISGGLYIVHGVSKNGGLVKTRTKQLEQTVFAKNICRMVTPSESVNCLHAVKETTVTPVPGKDKTLSVPKENRVTAVPKNAFMRTAVLARSLRDLHSLKDPGKILNAAKVYKKLPEPERLKEEGHEEVVTTSFFMTAALSESLSCQYTIKDTNKPDDEKECEKLREFVIHVEERHKSVTASNISVTSAAGLSRVEHEDKGSDVQNHNTFLQSVLDQGDCSNDVNVNCTSAAPQNFIDVPTGQDDSATADFVRENRTLPEPAGASSLTKRSSPSQGGVHSVKDAHKAVVPVKEYKIPMLTTKSEECRDDVIPGRSKVSTPTENHSGFRTPGNGNKTSSFIKDCLSSAAVSFKDCIDEGVADSISKKVPRIFNGLYITGFQGDDSKAAGCAKEIKRMPKQIAHREDICAEDIIKNISKRSSVSQNFTGFGSEVDETVTGIFVTEVKHLPEPVAETEECNNANVSDGVSRRTVSSQTYHGPQTILKGKKSAVPVKESKKLPGRVGASHAAQQRPDLSQKNGLHSALDENTTTVDEKEYQKLSEPVLNLEKCGDEGIANNTRKKASLSRRLDGIRPVTDAIKPVGILEEPTKVNESVLDVDECYDEGYESKNTSTEIESDTLAEEVIDDRCVTGRNTSGNSHQTDISSSDSDKFNDNEKESKKKLQEDASTSRLTNLPGRPNSGANANLQKCHSAKERRTVRFSEDRCPTSLSTDFGNRSKENTTRNWNQTLQWTRRQKGSATTLSPQCHSDQRTTSDAVLDLLSSRPAFLPLSRRSAGMGRQLWSLAETDGSSGVVKFLSDTIISNPCPLHLLNHPIKTLCTASRKMTRNRLNSPQESDASKGQEISVDKKMTDSKDELNDFANRQRSFIVSASGLQNKDGVPVSRQVLPSRRQCVHGDGASVSYKAPESENPSRVCPVGSGKKSLSFLKEYKTPPDAPASLKECPHQITVTPAGEPPQVFLPEPQPTQAGDTSDNFKISGFSHPLLTVSPAAMAPQVLSSKPQLVKVGHTRDSFKDSLMSHPHVTVTPTAGAPQVLPSKQQFFQADHTADIPSTTSHLPFTVASKTVSNEEQPSGEAAAQSAVQPSRHLLTSLVDMDALVHLFVPEQLSGPPPFKQQFRRIPLHRNSRELSDLKVTGHLMVSPVQRAVTSVECCPETRPLISSRATPKQSKNVPVRFLGTLPLPRKKKIA